MRTGVVIVGGGISGLSAAYELQRQAVPFVLFEKAAQCGGVMRTEHVDGLLLTASGFRGSGIADCARRQVVRIASSHLNARSA